ncbi:hypothetical protein D3C78_1100000 [compost metagenome]
MQNVAGFVQRGEHAAQVHLLGALAVVVGVVLGGHGRSAIERVGIGAGKLDAHAAVVVLGPVHQVVDGVTLGSGNPLGAGGLFQTEDGVEAAEADVDRLETGVSDRGFVEIAIVGTIIATSVVGQIVVDLVHPVLVGNAADFQEGAAEVGRVLAAAIRSVEAVKLAVVRLQATTDLESELLVGGSHFQTTLGLDNDIGAIGGHGTGNGLSGNGQGQGAGGNAGEVLADHQGFPLYGLTLVNTRAWPVSFWGGIFAADCVSQVACM